MEGDMIYAKLPDGSDNPEWLAARCGKITASEVYRVVGSKLTAATYLNEKLTERLTGQLTGHLVTDAMRRGLELEPVAGERYERVNDVSLIQGYWMWDERGFGATPDYIVDGGGLVEIKCPLRATSVVGILYGEDLLGVKHKSADKYYWQCVAQMAAADEPWCDLTFYCPDMSRYGMQLLSRRIERDAKIEARMCAAIVEANNALGVAFEQVMAPRYKWVTDEIIPAIREAKSMERIQELEGEIYARIGSALPKPLEAAVDAASRERAMEIPTALMG